ncbi:AraC family transcriptional regulator [Saccharopolyspora sp. CA-218241]|uniref:AraC family transcriptional regulator n=1 Tax=Saccharopolyspora sp. CA-218241 TaxID=3240027 RepID=UPI003D9A05BA
MRAPQGCPQAIVFPEPGRRAFDVERLAPAADLAEFVDYHWVVRWRVEGVHRQQVVPQPRVHLAVEDGRVLVHGVTREPFHRELRGTGHVLGVAFHPAGFRPVLHRAVADVAGRYRPGAEVLGVDDREVAARVLATGSTRRMVAAVEEYLRACRPRPDPVAARVSELVRTAERDPSLVRADQLADRAGMGLRRLQRLFAEYVGIGPKWVIRRFRILDALGRAGAPAAGAPLDWAALADELGFADQAHLIRVFTQVVGTPPATYRRTAAG